MRSVESGNRIIMNISDRDRSDIVLYPLMISAVLFTYIAILLYYTITLFSVHGTNVPYEQMFGVLALILIGISLILAVFYLLMARSSSHSKREAELRNAMISYIDSNNVICGTNLSGYIRQMAAMDERFAREESMRDPKKNMVWITAPAFAGFMIMWIPQIRGYAMIVMAVSFILCILTALAVAPAMTTFAAKHDKRTREFVESFVNAYGAMGIKLVPVSRTVGFRSFRLFAMLTAVTAGLFAIYWVYLVFGDMNRHFMEQWRFEDRLLRSVRSSNIEAVRKGLRDTGYTLEDGWL